MSDINKDNFQPLVSIIIPVFNGSNYLNEAIGSALNQDYKNIEVLVVNDGSDDGGQTESIALAYGSRIRYFYKPNGGVASALNLGISEMKGEYFSWLSHDDVYYPNKISAQVKHIEALSDQSEVIFSGFDIINGKGKKLNSVLPLKRYSIEQLETPLFALLHGMISGCSLLIHKSHFERVGIFCEDLATTQDFDLWFRIMRNQPCRICESVLHKTRVHETQGSRVYKDKHQQEGDELWINIMEQLTESEKIQINGSVKKFYRNMYLLLLKYTTHHTAMCHAKSKSIESVGLRGTIARWWLELYSAYILSREMLSMIKRRVRRQSYRGVL